MEKKLKLSVAVVMSLCLTSQMSAMELPASVDSSEALTAKTTQATYHNWSPEQILEIGKNFIEGKQIQSPMDGKCGTLHSIAQIFPEYYADGFFVPSPGASVEDYYKTYQTLTSLKHLVLAARMGLSKAQLELGLYHYNRHQVSDQSIMKMYEAPNNFCVAFYLLTEAAQQGDPLANCALGQFYYRGEYKRGCEAPMIAPNLVNAFSCFTLGARHNISEAHYMLGKLYEEGDVINRDMDKAVEYYKIAAQGEINRSGTKEAQKRLEELGLSL